MKLVMPLAAAALCAALVYPVIPTTVYFAPSLPTPESTYSISDVLMATGGRECVKSGTWKSKTPPSWAVVRYLNGTLSGTTFDKAWDLATDGKVWVLLLCEE